MNRTDQRDRLYRWTGLKIGSKEVCIVCVVAVVLALILSAALSPWFVTIGVAAMAIIGFALTFKL